MKKVFLLVLACLLIGQEGYSQNSRTRGNRSKNRAKHCQVIGFGVNYALPARTGFDDMLDDFNQKHATTDGKYALTTPFMGASLLYTSYGNHGEQRAQMWYEFGLHGSTRSMAGKEMISNQASNISQQYYTGHIGIGAVPIQTHNFDLALALSGDGGLFHTNANGANALERYAYTQDDFFYAVTAQMPVYIYFGEHFSLGLRPYYQYQLNTLSFQKLQNLMTKSTTQVLPVDKDMTLSKFSNYGIYVHLNITFGKVKDIQR